MAAKGAEGQDRIPCEICCYGHFPETEELSLKYRGRKQTEQRVRMRKRRVDHPGGRASLELEGA